MEQEGVRLVPYSDQFGNETVGVGHNLVANPIPDSMWEPDHTISPETCDALLSQDITVATTALVLNCAPWFQALGDVRQAVMIRSAFSSAGLG